MSFLNNPSYKKPENSSSSIFSLGMCIFELVSQMDILKYFYNFKINKIYLKKIQKFLNELF